MLGGVLITSDMWGKNIFEVKFTLYEEGETMTLNLV